MNQQQKEQWVAALRSGKYQQGRGILKSSDNRYCCLGVAAEVCGIESANAAYLKQHPLDDAIITSDSNFVFLPHETQCKLSDMNDGGQSFAEIADYIEQHVAPTE